MASSSHIVTLDSFFSSILRSASLELGLEPDFVTKIQGHEKFETHFLDEIKAQGLLSSLVHLAIDIEDKRFVKIFDLLQNFYKVDPLLPEQDHSLGDMATLEKQIETLRDSLYQRVIASGASKTAMNNFMPMSIKQLSSKTVFQKESLLLHNLYKKYIAKDPEIEVGFLALKALLYDWVKTKERVVFYNLFKVYDYYKNATITTAKSSKVLTFDDLTYFTYRLLHESMSKEFLYFKIDAKFKHILLDEFQDTSTLQFLLLKPLIDEIFAGQGAGDFKSFFYVGDTKQSLYRFRGGVEELFDKVAQNYGITVEQMDTNYRSAKAITSQVNHWFEPSMQGYIPQKSRDNAPQGYVSVVQSDTLIDEAVVQAKALLDLGIAVDSIAFLVSTNKDGQTLQERCEEEGINTLLKTSSSLKHIPKIASLVTMCRYLFFGEKIDAQAMLIKTGKSMDTLNVGWFSAFMSPLQVLDRLVREFGYFGDDLNILKLLEFASHFSNIPTFIEEFDSSSISVASNSMHGAKIMTIHGSKGLEFDYVIVLDKLTRKNSDKSALLYHYSDDLMIESILYRTKGREHLDSYYAEILAKRKVSEAKDRMNVLYVALTRAVDGLIVIRKPKDSIFDILGMECMSVGTHIIPQSPRQLESLEKVSVVLTHYGTQESLVEAEEEEKDYEAMLFGTALHYALEMLGDFSPSYIEASLLSMQHKYAQELGQENIQKIAHILERLLAHQPFQALLKNASISKEQSLSYEGELKQIDLLLEYETYNLVIDYKSSQKYALKHQSQVRFYQQAIQSITGKPTQGMILYLLKDEIILGHLA
ncbi:MAG: RecB-like helicase [Sulfurovum sp.]|nr:RecB-like helicase [Sulfurovum sp.]